MKSKIQIEKLCGVDFESMKSQSDGKFCDVCQTKVVDFTAMSLDEIKIYFTRQKNENICGRYQARHLTGNNQWYGFLNRIESAFFRTKFRKASFWIITILLFLTNNTACLMGKRLESKPNEGKKAPQKPVKLKPASR